MLMKVVFVLFPLILPFVPIIIIIIIMLGKQYKGKNAAQTFSIVTKWVSMVPLGMQGKTNSIAIKHVECNNLSYKRGKKQLLHKNIQNNISSDKTQQL